MLIGVLPMLALQIQAVTDSISILTRDPAQERVAFVFCTLITLFAILFGARHIATRERHEGLVFAIAFESLVKLVMLGSIGLYALYWRLRRAGRPGSLAAAEPDRADHPAHAAGRRSMANAAAGVLRRGHRDAAHVPHDLHREPQPARADFPPVGACRCSCC